MALKKPLSEIRAGVRRFANIQGQTALVRHPNADIDDGINIALGSLHRRLTTVLPDQRFLGSATITTSSGVSTYALPSDFDSLISIELTANGQRVGMDAYEMNERPELLNPGSSAAFTGVPSVYRLRGENIEFLPVPTDVYSPLIWYVPNTPQLAGDAETYDTISRLDMYIVAYAARIVAIKDKNWDLKDACSQVMGELEAEIDVLARNRDRNSPPRIVDTQTRDRWGRACTRGRRF